MLIINKKELNALKRQNYATPINIHLWTIKSYHGIDQMRKEQQILINNGYDIKKDYMILKDCALCPAHISEV